MPSFPPELTKAFIEQTGVPGILGDCHASGTEILDELGLSTSGRASRSATRPRIRFFQIAAHEDALRLDRLYEHCHIARKLVDKQRRPRDRAPFVNEARH